MVGTGEGQFSPNAVLTEAECLTLALRLYDLQKGGSGELLTAPQEWGTITLTLSDGTVFQQGREHSPTFGYDHFMVRLQPDLYRFYVLAPGETVIEQRAWATVHEGPAELSMGHATRGGQRPSAQMASPVWSFFLMTAAWRKNLSCITVSLPLCPRQTIGARTRYIPHGSGNSLASPDLTLCFCSDTPI